MKLDPEEQIIAAALDQAELDDANERGVAARIEFRPEGHAKVTFTISREFVETARALDWTTGELVTEAIGIAIPPVRRPDGTIATLHRSAGVALKDAEHEYLALFASEAVEAGQHMVRSRQSSADPAPEG